MLYLGLVALSSLKVGHQEILQLPILATQFIILSDPRLPDDHVVLVSSVSGHHLDTQTLKNHPQGHPKNVVSNFLKRQFQAKK